MQTHHSRQRQVAPSYLIARVVIETLKQTNGKRTVSIPQIADRSRATTEQVGRILGYLLQLEDPSGAELSNSTRFKLAFEAVRHGALQQVASALSWQEFEGFTEECLRSVGFDTQKGVTLKDDSRGWQIDVIAKKGPMILAVDCKHWESPGYSSKLAKATEHQRLAVQALIQRMIARGEVGREGVIALPIVLILFKPRSRLANGAVVVSIEQFADFLEGISPYSSELPFISARNVAKSSIS